MPDVSPQSRAWAEIDAGALRHNIALLHRRYASGGTRLMAVVKADAYGHGMALIAPLAARAGVTDFGVATVAEGVALRALLPDAAIFLITLTLPSDAEIIVAHRLTSLLSTQEMGCALANAARARGVTAQAHLEADTGIGRAGALLGDVPRLLAALDALPGLRVTGLATHFARADEDLDDAQAQYGEFAALLAGLGTQADSLLIHADNSPAALRLPAVTRHALIRPGLLLYGIEPAPGMFAAADLPLRPVLSLKARVLLCRPLPGGATISYGRTYAVPPGGGVYATLALGYGDGFPRRLSGGGHVLLHGRRAPLCGRVCMDQLVVDVTDIPSVRSGDTATAIGADGDAQITAAELAAAIATTPHEITTCLTARLPRLLIG
ncbi:MAG: alanine racemase [Armatimonadetes bacterium]|nr:alanine racemase [Armatimonadota bacterium]